MTGPIWTPLSRTVADLQRFYRVDERGDELVVDAVFDNDAARGGAFLSRREHRRVDGAADGLLEIGVGENDGGVLAAHFELNAQSPRRRLRMQRPADRARARERHRFHRFGVDHGLSDLAARAADEVDDAAGDAGLMAGFGDPPTAQRRGGRRFHEHGIARDQRRSQLPGRDGAGEIPGVDLGHDSQRTAHRIHEDAVALGGDQHARHARALCGEVAENVDRAHRFAGRFGQRLALLARHLAGQGIEVALEDVGDLEQIFAALRGVHRRPRRIRLLGGRRCGSDVGSIALAKHADAVAGVRRVAVFECALGSGPFAGDVIRKGFNLGHGILRHR